MRFDELFDQYLLFRASRITHSSMLTYKTTILIFTDWLKRTQKREVEQLTTEGIMRFMKSCQQRGVSQGRLATVICLVRAVLSFAVRRGVISVNPAGTDYILKPTVPAPAHPRKPINRAQFLAVYQTAQARALYSEFFYQEELPLLLMIGWHTGLRLSDCCRLEWSQVDFEEQVITAWPQKRKASGQKLEIPLAPELRQHLREWQQKTGTRSGPINPRLSQSHRVRGHSDIGRSVKRIFSRAGLRGDYSFHSLRHSFVTRLLNSGQNPILIGSMTGQSLEMIKRYAHVSMEAKRAALEKAEAA